MTAIEKCKCVRGTGEFSEIVSTINCPIHHVGAKMQTPLNPTTPEGINEVLKLVVPTTPEKETPTPKTVEEVVAEFKEHEVITMLRGCSDLNLSELDSLTDWLRQTLTVQNQAADERLLEVAKDLLALPYGTNGADYMGVDRRDIENLLAKHGITNL